MGSDRVRAYRKSSSTLNPGFKRKKSSLLKQRYQDQVEPETDTFTKDKQQNTWSQSNPTSPFLGHSFGRMSILPIQAKLTVGQPGDKYEQEADRVADQVMRMPEPKIQRVCPQCEEELQRQPKEEHEEEETLQTKPMTDSIMSMIQKQRAESDEEEENALQMKPLASQITPLIQRQAESSKEEEEDETLQAKARAGQTLQGLSSDGRETVQRESIEDEEDEETLQTKSMIYQVSPLMQRQTAGEVDVTENRNSLPNFLKLGLEHLSGRDLSEVRVHYNDSKPSQVNALAYTQGQEIHLGPGQDKHLPHEGWHVVQQMQGRVKPTIQANGVSINDDKELEQEADRMGAKASQIKETQPGSLGLGSTQPRSPVGQFRSQSQVLSLKSKNLCKKKFDATKYVKATVNKGESMKPLVDRLIKAGKITVNGRRQIYANKMQALNYKKGDWMHPGDCLIMQKQWNDPNIAQLPSKKTIKSDLMAKIIATIYGEQTQDIPEQHRYIWYSIRKRIESWERPAKLVYPGAKKGVLSQYDAFGNTQYKRAKDYLLNGKKYKKEKLNSDVVDNIKKMVESEWDTKIAKDAGMFYFHWTENVSPTLNKCWKRKDNAKKSDQDRENTCVEEFRKQLKWEAKLVKSIPQTGTGKKGSPPFGTMYIFQSTRQP